MGTQRPDWDMYFMEIAQVVAKRSNCIRRSVGCVIVRDRRIISTGYNGAPMGITNCDSGGCDRCKKRQRGEIGPETDENKCVCAHAEENAIVQSALHGISTKGATLYTTLSPCGLCAKMIINAGIARVVAHTKFIDDFGLKLLKQAGIRINVIR